MIVVYFRGYEARGSAWYRVDLVETTKSEGKKKRRWRTESKKRETISPAAVLPVVDFGYNGGWAVIEDDIYVAGGWFRGDDMKRIVNKDVIKHNIHHPDPTSWEKVFSLKTPRTSSFLAAVGRKLAVVAGNSTDGRIKGINDDMVVDDVNDSKWRKCGEIYDLDNQTSEYLSSDIAHFEHYLPWDASTTVVEGKTQIVFYSLVQGSMLILDASTGEIVKEGYPDSLPPGIHGSFIPITLATGSSAGVFHDSTFYYFTYELRLYGYDVHQRRWLLSECLGDKYPQLKPKTVHTDPDFPLLVGLPNGKLLVLIFRERGVFTMAPLSVRKNDSSLDVKVDVEHIQYFHPHDTSFYPYEGKAM